MKVIDDGIIKYDRTNFSLSYPLPEIEYAQLEYWRKKLYKINLIGEYPFEKIGFGNISMVTDYSRFAITSQPQFLITGSQTGKYSNLDGRHYTRILDYSIDNIVVTILGPIEASSEVLTHAAIYEHNKNINSVFHIHSEKMWNYMIQNNYPYTAREIAYGTLEMARATQSCIGECDSGIFCMHGHVDGIVAYGKTLDETWNKIIEVYELAN